MSWGKDIKHCPVELLTFNPPGAKTISNNAMEHLEYGGKSLPNCRAEHLEDFPNFAAGYLKHGRRMAYRILDAIRFSDDDDGYPRSDPCGMDDRRGRAADTSTYVQVSESSRMC